MKKFVKYLACLSSTVLLASCGAKLKFSDKEEVKRNIKRLCEEGLEVDLNVTASSDEDLNGTYHFGYKGDIMWLYNVEKKDSADDNFAVKLFEEEDYLNVYTYDSETESYLYKEKVEGIDENIEQYREIAYNCFTYANNVSSLLKEKEHTTIAGRECTVYEFRFSGIVSKFGGQADINIYVDDETGMTLKATHHLAAGDQAKGDFDFEVLSFNTVGVIAPVLVDLEA